MSTLGLALMFGGAIVIYWALGGKKANPLPQSTVGAGSGFSPDAGVGGGGGDGGGGSW